MITAQKLIEELNATELSRMNMGGNSNNGASRNNTDELLVYINDGIKKTESLLHLNTPVLLKVLITKGITNYLIKADNVVGSGSGEHEHIHDPNNQFPLNPVKVVNFRNNHKKIISQFMGYDCNRLVLKSPLEIEVSEDTNLSEVFIELDYVSPDISITDVIPLPDVLLLALKHYVVYRCWNTRANIDTNNERHRYRNMYRAELEEQRAANKTQTLPIETTEELPLFERQGFI